VFNSAGYDIVLCLATYHKLKRLMPERDLSELMKFFGRWTRKYFGWRGTSDKPQENEQEIESLDRDFRDRTAPDPHLLHLGRPRRRRDLGAAMPMLQDDPRDRGTCRPVQGEGVRSYLEIGAKFGGSLWRAAQALPKGSRIVAVDLPNGTKAWNAEQHSLSPGRELKRAATTPA
jgi:hypothetical protein